MKQLVAIVCILFLVACGTPQATAPQAVNQPQAQPAETPPVQAVDTSSQPVTSNIGNVQTQTGAYRSGRTLNVPLAFTASGYDPKILTVGYGDRVKISITNEDTKAHTFTIANYDIDQRVEPGDTELVDFYSDVKGEYAYTDKYGFTKGTLIVGGST